MRKIILAITSLLMFNGLAQVKLPPSHKFFEDEPLMRKTTIKGGEVRVLSTTKTFQALKDELIGTLGEGWISKPPSDPKIVTEDQKKKIAFSTKDIVIYVNPQDPKLQVSITLTSLKGRNAQEKVALLTIMRDLTPVK